MIMAGGGRAVRKIASRHRASCRAQTFGGGARGLQPSRAPHLAHNLRLLMHTKFETNIDDAASAPVFAEARPMHRRKKQTFGGGARGLQPSRAPHLAHNLRLLTHTNVRDEHRQCRIRAGIRRSTAPCTDAKSKHSEAARGASSPRARRISHTTCGYSSTPTSAMRHRLSHAPRHRCPHAPIAKKRLRRRRAGPPALARAASRTQRAVTHAHQHRQCGISSRTHRDTDALTHDRFLAIGSCRFGELEPHAPSPHLDLQ